MSMTREIGEYLAGHAAVFAALEKLAPEIERACVHVADTLQRGDRVWLAGNGGSASDALHIACEMEGRFLVERPARAVHALCANVSTLTSVGNDYGYDDVFARQVEGFVGRGDLVWLISTSGESPNLLAAARAARAKEAAVLGFSGKGGGALRELCDLCLTVPSDFTPWIQEAHIAMGHIVCREVDRLLGRDD